jgi:hypothetical protein
MTMYAIYDHPKDHPDHYVVRRWFIKSKPEEKVAEPPLAMFPSTVDPTLEPEWGGLYPNARVNTGPKGVRTLSTGDPLLEVETAAQLAGSLGEARNLIPQGYIRQKRWEVDDPVIIEVWL